MDARWEEIDHTADWAIRVQAPDLQALFETAAKGMLALAGGTPGQRGTLIQQSFTLEAPDLETLLVDWLSELVYLIEDEGALISDVQVEMLGNTHLTALVRGQSGGHFDKHIKAVTYHNLSIQPIAGGYETTIIFDV